LPGQLGSSRRVEPELLVVDVPNPLVQALDAAHAQDIARAQHPTGRMSAVPAELLDGQDHHQMLMAWISAEE
jgi:hypothetical protein